MVSAEICKTFKKQTLFQGDLEEAREARKATARRFLKPQILLMQTLRPLLLGIQEEVHWPLLLFARVEEQLLLLLTMGDAQSAGLSIGKV